MAKVINFTYKDKDYTLEYTRKNIRKNGNRWNEMYNKLSDNGEMIIVDLILR